jgi:L-galactono-1,4-lactone dehydrogenase
VKYLHIPYTDAVVVVTCNPVSKWKGPPKYKPKYTTDEALQHVRDLYKESLEKYRYTALSESAVTIIYPSCFPSLFIISYLLR